MEDWVFNRIQNTNFCQCCLCSWDMYMWKASMCFTRFSYQLSVIYFVHKQLVAWLLPWYRKTPLYTNKLRDHMLPAGSWRFVSSLGRRCTWWFSWPWRSTWQISTAWSWPGTRARCSNVFYPFILEDSLSRSKIRSTDFPRTKWDYFTACSVPGYYIRIWQKISCLGFHDLQ